MKTKLHLVGLLACASLVLPPLSGQQTPPLADGLAPAGACVSGHPWQNKRVAFLGDSITDPNCYGNNIRKYWDFLGDWLHLTPYVYGVSGRQWNDVPHQAERLQQEHGSEFDAIVILMGTNDFNSGVPIGEWYTETEEQVWAATGEMKRLEARKRRVPILSEATVKGRINLALRDLKARFPDKQIVLLTPLHRALADFGDKNLQPDESFQNKCGEYIDAYVEAVKEAGNVWAVPVIDLNAVSGMNPMVEEQLGYFYDRGYDRLHPSTKGQERMARTLLYQLSSLPASF